MDAWIAWIVAAVLLIVVEVISQWVWTFCLAIGCVIALISDLAGAPLALQTGIAAVGAVVAYFACVPFMRRWYARSTGGNDARTGMDALLGRRGVVVDEIKPGELGRVRIDGDCWQVKAPGTETKIDRGGYVSVTGYDSIILSVEPINQLKD